MVYFLKTQIYFQHIETTFIVHKSVCLKCDLCTLIDTEYNDFIFSDLFIRKELITIVITRISGTKLVKNGDMENTSHWSCTWFHMHMELIYFYHRAHWQARVWRLQSWFTTETWRTRATGSVPGVIWNWTTTLTTDNTALKFLAGQYMMPSRIKH